MLPGKPQQAQRFYHSEATPVPSTMSALLLQQQQQHHHHHHQQHRDSDGFRPSVAQHLQSAHLPPSPPLTRRSTASVRSSPGPNSNYSPVQRPNPLPVGFAEGTGTLQQQQQQQPSARQSTSSPPPPGSSNVSLKEVRKEGKRLGQKPIDYLIPNGGLSAPVSGFFHPTSDPFGLAPPPGAATLRRLGPRDNTNDKDVDIDDNDNDVDADNDSPYNTNPVAGIFGNLTFLLDSYQAILSSGGSVAVGTGYHPVARRLLERVETLFARDLGVGTAGGWAQVLEYLRGGRQKPSLCVLPVRGLLAKRDAPDTVINATNQNHNPANPSPDHADGPQRQPPLANTITITPATTRELAESVVATVKVKPAMTKVEQWLEEVEQVLRASHLDDDHDDGNRSNDKANDKESQAAAAKASEEEEDNVVCEIIEGILKSNTEEGQIKHFRRYLEDAALVSSTRLALTRLYPDHPPESITPPIVALFLLLHPELHPLLHALANVTSQELELIHSGRFDALLDGASNVVQRDEDEELRVIAALDRRLWTVLEALEDEIEELHTRALVVRRALKSRKECIVSRRRPSAASGPSPSPPSRSTSPTPTLVLPQPPTSKDDKTAAAAAMTASRSQQQQQQEDDDDWAENVPTLHLPIMPDDSASNISMHRRRRQERASKLMINNHHHIHHHHSRRDSIGKGDDKRRKRERKDRKDRKASGAGLAGGAGLGGLVHLKEYPIKSGEFGPPPTALDNGGGGDKSDGGGTVVSMRRRKKKDGAGGRCNECGSCVASKDDKKDKDDSKDRKKSGDGKGKGGKDREKDKDKGKDKDNDKEKDKEKEKEKEKEKGKDREKEKEKQKEKEKEKDKDKHKHPKESSREAKASKETGAS